MGRAFSTAFCAALLVVAAGAFALTEGEKTALSAIYNTSVKTPGKVFSPTCDTRIVPSGSCHRDGVISFQVRVAGWVEVWMVSAATGKRVRTVITGKHFPANGLVQVVFTGRRADGALLPSGAYLPVVRLLTQQLTFKLPNPITLDTVPPKVERPSRLLHLLFAPLAAGKPHLVQIAYRLNGPAHGVLFVDGHQVAFTYRQPLSGVLSWDGEVDDRRVAAGEYTLEVGAQDEAGNRAVPFAVAVVSVRYIELGRPQITVKPDHAIVEPILLWRGRVEYRLDGHRGTTDSHVLHLRAPARRGGYRLIVTGGGHGASAKVLVR